MKDSMKSSLISEQVLVRTSIAEVPVTAERNPYNPGSFTRKKLPNPGIPHVNIAPATTAPSGTQVNQWAAKHAHQTVLQQHCDFFDRDGDGIVWPLDTYNAFRDLGFNLLICVLAVLFIHSGLSYPTCPAILPDPLFRIYLKNIHKAKHGSDTDTYDNEGRFVPQKFEDFFAKFGSTQDGLTKKDLWNGVKAQRVTMDPFGWLSSALEWTITYVLIWPEDGILKKEDVRKVYDGSIFYEIAAKRRDVKKIAWSF